MCLNINDAVVCGVKGAFEVRVHDVDVFVVEFGVLHHHDDGGEGVVYVALVAEITIMLVIEIEIEIVYSMYRMRRFTTITVCAGCCLWALPTMPYMMLTIQG
jgi:hypothetical protein